MNKKNLKNKIKELQTQSLSKNEIYRQLETLVEEKDKDWFVRQIAGITNSDKRKKYKVLNNILLIILTLQSLIFVIETYISFNQTGNIKFLIELILGTVISFTFIVGIYKYKLFFYSTLITLGILGIILNLFYLIIGVYSLNYLWLAVYDLIMIIYIFQVRKNIFPDVNFWGNAIKGKEGKYIFSE